MAEPSPNGHALRTYVARMRALTKSVTERNARIHSRIAGERAKRQDDRPHVRDRPHEST